MRFRSVTFPTKNRGLEPARAVWIYRVIGLGGDMIGRVKANDIHTAAKIAVREWGNAVYEIQRIEENPS